MNRRFVCMGAVLCLLLVPFVTGCPGENAVSTGLADGLSEAIGAFVADLLSSALETA